MPTASQTDYLEFGIEQVLSMFSAGVSVVYEQLDDDFSSIRPTIRNILADLSAPFAVPAYPV